MRKKVSYSCTHLYLLFLILQLSAFNSDAEPYSNLILTLHETRMLKTGWLNDGEIVIDGNASTNGSEQHKGFSLTIQGANFIDARHFKFINANNPSEFINVRISGAEWGIDPTNSSRVLRFTLEKNINFQLVSDGNQYIHAGKYNAAINIATIN